MSINSKVLLVDDDERLLKAAKRILRKTVNLHTAAGGAAALEMLEKNEPYSVIISDQNMPEIKGDALLAEASKRWPLTVRIMLTGNNDLATAVSAVNSGHIFRFLNKPCETKDLLAAIQDGQRHYDLLTSEKELLEQTLSGSVKVLFDVLALTSPKAFKNASEVRMLTKVIAKRIKLERPWELEIASMLWPLGDIALPIELISKMASDELLSASEQEIVMQSPKSARDLICNIPRMENIAETIYYSGKCFDGSGFPEDKIIGEAIPEHARLLHILIDFVKARSKHNSSDIDAFLCLKEVSHRYDPELLTVVAKTLRDQVQSTIEDHNHINKTVAPVGLLEGDIIVNDIIDNQKKLLLSAGNELTKLMIQRLKNMHKLALIPDTLQVKRKAVS